MNRTGPFLLALILVAAVANSVAIATVGLNNYDADKPIFYLVEGWKARGNDVWVEVLGGPVGGSLAPVANTLAKAQFQLSEPGFFDGGTGIIPGLKDGSQAEFALRVWKGGDSWETSPENNPYPLRWIQATGSWNGEAIPPVPPTGPSLALPASVTFPAIPEPSVLVLLAVGAGILLSKSRARYPFRISLTGQR